MTTQNTAATRKSKLAEYEQNGFASRQILNRRLIVFGREELRRWKVVTGLGRSPSKAQIPEE